MAEAMDIGAYLEPEDYDAPLHFLRYSCVERISFHLNKRVVQKRGMRHTPNYGGLAELIGFDGLEISNLKNMENPGLAVLDRWKSRQSSNATVGNLVKYLLQLGRNDILIDTAETIKEEIKFHKDKAKNIKLDVQCETVSSSSPSYPKDDVLTTDDVIEGRTVMYDAFICYGPTDVEFVRLLLARLEDPRFGFRFFVPGRNNLPTTHGYSTTTKIISERCRHMIVIISNSFIQSDACEFQSSYAFALDAGARDKKIIPIKIEPCPTPGILQIMATCDFHGGNVDWAWRRLIMSLLSPMNNNKEFLGSPKFVPPPGSALVNLRQGMAELGIGGNSQSFSRDSGISSFSSSSRNQVSTAPLPSRPSISSGQSMGSARSSHTVPVLGQEQPQREKSPGPVSQIFDKFFSSSKKKSKSSDKLSDKKTQDESMDEDH